MDDLYVSGSIVCFAKPPAPVGYWILYPGASRSIQFMMYKKPTPEQIKNTEELLGWGWVDFHETKGGA